MNYNFAEDGVEWLSINSLLGGKQSATIVHIYFCSIEL